MVSNAEQIGTAVTVDKDKRITRVGEKLRSLRLDELPQVLDVLSGNMSFVGTRPEAVKYVEQYRPEYYATLLLPAGITSEASIRYKDENKLLSDAENVDRVYLELVLPDKMRWNLEEIKRFSILRELGTMFRTVAAVCGKVFD
jgi:lipopolysaccharide/colanic/teichoic acid biosynthesis glycosyltransferase